MSNTTDGLTTAEELATMPDDGTRYELVDGALRRMSPAGFRHGQVAARLLSRIAAYVEFHQSGVALAAETGFLLRRDPDTVLAPDMAFVARDRLNEFAQHVGYLPIAPDLVAEVVSPTERSRRIETKVSAWLEAGVRVVLVVDPEAATVGVYRPNSPPRFFTEGFLEVDDLLPGFQLDVPELFA